MGTEATRLNSGIQGYMENCSWLRALIYRKYAFWHAKKINDIEYHFGIRGRSIASNSKIIL